MRQRSDFVLWSGLLVAGPWSTLLLGYGGVTFVLAPVARALHIPDYGKHVYFVGYHVGQGVVIVALLSAIVGVPVVARCYRVGFWRGLLGVILALGWLIISYLLLRLLLAPIRFGVYIAAINFAMAAVCAAILHRRRRIKPLDPGSAGDIFS